MDDMWMKIGSAVLLGAMIALLLPRARHMIQNSPAAHRDIEVHEADQKFFRSLVVLALAVGIGAAIERDWVLAAIALAAALASFMRYYNRRLKTVTLAYLHVLTMHRSGAISFRPVEETPHTP